MTEQNDQQSELVQLSANEKLPERIIQFARINVPKGIRPVDDSIEIPPVNIEFPVSVVEIDISGFTALCERVDPDAILSRLNKVFNFVIDKANQIIEDDSDCDVETSDFIGDAIRLKFTGSNHIDCASRFRDGIRQELEELTDKVGFSGVHLAVCHGLETRFLIGKHGHMLKWDTGQPNYDVEKEKDSQGTCEIASCNKITHPEPRGTIFDYVDADHRLVKRFDQEDEAESIGYRLKKCHVVMIHFKNLLEIQEKLKQNGYHDYIQWLNTLDNEIQQIIEQYNGAKISFCSGRLLITFGTEVTDNPEDNSIQNAYLACEEIKRSLIEFDQTSSADCPFEWGIGLSSGEVFCGINGNGKTDVRMNYIGKPVNTAARLAVNANHGECIYTRDVIQSLGISVREPLKRVLHLKGIGEVVVIDTKNISSEVTSGIFPNKIEELDHWNNNDIKQKFIESESTIKVIHGKSGSGTSCFLQSVRETDRTYHDIYISPHHMNIPFGGIIQIFKDVLDTNHDGQISEEEIDELFDNDSFKLEDEELRKHLEQVLRKILAITSNVESVTEVDIAQILEIIFKNLKGNHAFQIYNAEYFSDKSLKIILKTLNENPPTELDIKFEFEVHTDKSSSVDNSPKILHQNIDTDNSEDRTIASFRLPELTYESYKKVALASLGLGTIECHENFDAFLKRIFDSDKGNLRNLNELCSRLTERNDVIVSGNAVYIDKNKAKAYFNEIGTHFDEWVVSVFEEDNYNIFKIVLELSAIGNQFRQTIAEQFLGGDRFLILLAHKKKCERIGVYFENGDIIFTDEAIWSILHNKASATKRATWHEKVFRVLETNLEGTYIEALAYHAFQSGHIDANLDIDKKNKRLEKAGKYYYITGIEAFLTGSFQNAAFCLNRAYHLYLGSLSTEEQRRLYYSLSASLRMIELDEYNDHELMNNSNYVATNTQDLIHKCGKNLDKAHNIQEVYWGTKSSVLGIELQLQKKENMSKGELVSIRDSIEKLLLEINDKKNEYKNWDIEKFIELEIAISILDIRVSFELDRDNEEGNMQICSKLQKMGDELENIMQEIDSPVLQKCFIQLNIELGFYNLLFDKRKTLDIWLDTLKYLEEKTNMMKTTSGTLTYVELLNNIAEIYKRIEQHEIALFYIEKAIRIAQKNELHEVIKTTLLETLEEINVVLNQ